MKIRSVEELGEAIRTRRKELHYTQAFLAEFSVIVNHFLSFSVIPLKENDFLHKNTG